MYNKISNQKPKLWIVYFKADSSTVACYFKDYPFGMRLFFCFVKSVLSLGVTVNDICCWLQGSSYQTYLITRMGKVMSWTGTSTRISCYSINIAVRPWGQPPTYSVGTFPFLLYFVCMSIYFNNWQSVLLLL